MSGLRIAILTISDTRSLEDDRSGQYLAQAVRDAGHVLAARELVCDDRYRIRARVAQWIAEAEADAIITTGGTGITGRDCTPEAIAPLLDKTLDGFGELFRQLSFADIGAATLQSRCIGGVANRSLVFCLPGSTGAVSLAWEQILRSQLDIGTRPCNFAMLLPRLAEH